MPRKSVGTSLSFMGMQRCGGTEWACSSGLREAARKAAGEDSSCKLSFQKLSAEISGTGARPEEPCDSAGFRGDFSASW